VLRRLVDSRLLTSFEEEAVEGDGHHRVEVVHESLLSSWPRLVRWQTQDADAAQLRDQLRQAARTWDDHDRSDDLLWTGSAYREYSVWRERYPGGLTETEEAFGAGMTTLVTRRRRRRRIGIAAGFVVLLAGLAVVASFWRQSVRETRRAEAAELVAVGQLELEGYPTASVAHAIASLELFDSPAARILALEALWMGPTAMVINDEWTIQTVFTSDGKWLIQSRTATGTAPLRVIGADGSSEVLEYIQGGAATIVEAGVESGYFGLRGWDKDNTQDVEALWSAPERKRLAEVRYDRRTVGAVVIRSDQRRMLMTVHRKEERVAVDAIGFDGSRRSLGTINLDAETEDGELRVNMNAAGRYLAASTGHDIYVIAIEENGLSEPRLLGRQETPVTAVDMDERDRFVAAVDKDCRIGLWFLDDVRPPALIQGPPGGCGLHSPWDAGDVLVTLRSLMPPSDPGYWVWSLESGEPRLLRTFDFDREAIGSVRFWLNADYFVRAGPDQKIRLWALAGPPDAEPLTLLRGEVGQFWFAQFHPNGKWLVSPDESGLSMWPLARPYPTVFRGHGGQVNGVVAGPGGRWLASSSDDGSVRIWPLEGDPPAAGSAAYESDVPLEQMYGLSRSIDGAFLLVGNNRGGPRLLSTTGGESTVLEDAPENQIEGSTSPYGDTAFSVDGRFVAASSAIPEAALRRIGVWDVGTGEQIRVLAKGEARMYGSPQFLDDGSLIALDHSGVRRWNLETGENELVYAGTFHRCAIGRDQNRLLLLEARTHNDTGRAVIFDIESGVATPLESHGHRVQSVALDPSGSFAVTGDRDGVVRVGPVSGEEPHLLIGHENRVDAVAVDPESRWVASGGKDYSVRVWPMPDLSKPPLHTLPRDELIAKLKTLTNLRVVRDEESATGWKLTHDPFPGWETVPTW
jgi:WD40 repeat protein